MAENIPEVTDQDFAERVEKADGPVLVDFWAPWCGPCRMVAPVVADLASEYKGRLAFAKLNTDANVRTAVAYGVRSIPTLIVFDKGKEVDRIIGYLSKDMLKRRLDEGVLASVQHTSR